MEIHSLPNTSHHLHFPFAVALQMPTSLVFAPAPCLVETGPALPLTRVIASVWAAAHYLPVGVQ